MDKRIMNNPIVRMARDRELPIDAESAIRTIWDLKKMPMTRFPELLKDIYPEAEYANPIKTKYVLIYLIQEALNKAKAGIEINMERHLRECEDKADALLINHPMIDFMELPDFDPSNPLDYPESGQRRGNKISILKVVKEFCARHPDTDRKTLIDMVMDEFDIDKGKANTYVHLYLRDSNSIEGKSQGDGDQKRVSVLRQVKDFVADNLDEDRQELIEMVMDEFDIDKGKASTYVHLALKEFI